MQFDPDNHVVKLCAKGMEMELHQKPEEAKVLFLQAWDEATNDFEKFTSAHYIARHQQTIEDKLKWDKKALEFALKINDDMTSSFPSLYLNIAKCYEDLKDYDNAIKNYQTASSYAARLTDNGYGQIIQSGIQKGIERISKFYKPEH
jgi:rifampin ADP-ribosylating transferase